MEKSQTGHQNDANVDNVSVESNFLKIIMVYFDRFAYYVHNNLM